jgi:hypothetical protein
MTNGYRTGRPPYEAFIHRFALEAPVHMPEPAGVPLAEDVERYEVDILISGEHKRTLSAATPTCTYAAAEQIADFGALATQITIGVHQVSAVYGRGAAAVRTL